MNRICIYCGSQNTGAVLNDIYHDDDGLLIHEGGCYCRDCDGGWIELSREDGQIEDIPWIEPGKLGKA